MYVFHINQLNINELHDSQTLEALSLASSNLDSLSGNHRRTIITYQNHVDHTSRLPSKFRSLHGPTYAFWILTNNLSLKSTVESVVTDNRGGEQGSNDSILPENNSKERTTCISFLYYWFNICFCLTSPAKDDPRILRNESSIASN